MNAPCLVFPYQREPAQWNEPLLVLTQTCPLAAAAAVAVGVVAGIVLVD